MMVVRWAVRGLGLGMTGTLLIPAMGAAAAAPPAFPTVINQAMAVVAKTTTAPLEASTWTPKVGVNRIAKLGHLTAMTTQSKSAYQVNLYYTCKSVPVNDSAVLDTANRCTSGEPLNLDGDDQSYAWFGADRHASIAVAESAVRTNYYFWKVPKLTTPVTLNSRIPAQFWYRGPQRQEQSTIAWHVKGWSIELLASGFPKSVAVRSANGLTASVPRCPSSDGTIVVEVAADHTLVSAMWRTGRVTETVGSNFGTNPVVHLMQSLRSWTAPST